MQDTRCVGAYLNAGTHLPRHRRPLEDVHIEASAEQRERSRHTTDAATDHANRDLIWPTH